MWYPFKLTMRKQDRQISALRSHLNLILGEVFDIFDKSDARFVIGNPGSGSITFRIGKNSYKFNQFPHAFDGFYVNGECVGLREFLIKAKEGLERRGGRVA